MVYRIENLSKQRIPDTVTINLILTIRRAMWGFKFPTDNISILNYLVDGNSTGRIDPVLKRINRLHH